MFQHIVDATSTGSLYAVIALGVAVVFGVMKLINFAYGELIVIGGFIVFITESLPWPLVIICVLAAVAVVGFLMERVAFRPVRNADPTTMLITSFALAILLQNTMVWIFGRRAKGISFGASLAKPVNIGPASVPLVEVVTIGVIIAVLVAFVYLLKRTETGVQMRAAAEDFLMTRLLGVKANRVIGATFVASSLLAGVAAVLLMATTGTVSPEIGLKPVLVAFVATVIGGMGSLLGAAVGGFLLGFVTVMLQVLLPQAIESYRDAFLFGGVILVLLLRPQGLFASKALEERV